MSYEGISNIPTEGLVASYNLDGDATDSSGNGNDGTATDVTWVDSTRGYTKEVGSFNGSSSYVDTNYTYTSSSISISFWYKTSGGFIDTTGYFINNYGTGASDQHFACYLHEGDSRLNWFINDGGTHNGNMAYYNDALLDGKYHNVIVTYNSSDKNQAIFFDGVKVLSQTYDGNNPDFGQRAIELGRRIDNTRYLPGNIGLTKIYNRVLSEKEVFALYSEGLRKLGSPLALQAPELFENCVGYFVFGE